MLGALFARRPRIKTGRLVAFDIEIDVSKGALATTLVGGRVSRTFPDPYLLDVGSEISLSGEEGSAAIGILAALALIAYVGFSGGLVDLVFPDAADQAPAVTGLTVGEQQPAPAATLLYVQAHTQLSHPLGYAATVRDCLPSGRHCTQTRYYFAKQEAQ